jgi:hypothetical protein
LDTIFANEREHTCRFSFSYCDLHSFVYIATAIDISITGHSGIFNGVLRVIGRGNYPLPTGGKLVIFNRETSGINHVTGIFVAVVRPVEGP